MPDIGYTVGVYTGQLEAGTQVSSTYEGRHLTVRDDELIHPYILDTFVNKGDPVIVSDAGDHTVYGNIVGVAFNDGAAAADLIAIDTEGIWNLLVYAVDDIGNSNIEIGDCLYIRAGSLPDAADADGTGDAEISKMNDAAHQVFFGYALGSMVGGTNGRIAVKIHASPFPEMEERRYQTVATGAYGFHKTAIFAGGASTGLEYHDQRVTGAQTGGIYGWSSWMEMAAGFVHLDDALLVLGEFGIYEVGSVVADNFLVGIQLQYQLSGAPNYLYHFRVNVVAAGGAITAVFAAANLTSIGLVAGALSGANKIAGLPFVDIGGTIYYIYLYDASD